METTEDGPSKREIAEAEMAEEANRLEVELPLEPRWRLSETLLWIGLRNIRRVAEILPYLSRHFVEHGPGFRVAWVTGIVADMQGAAEAKPWPALRRALQRDAVDSTGKHGGLGDIGPINSVQWDVLDFIDGPKGGPRGNDYAIRDDWKPGYDLGTHWTHVRFDRKSVMRAFPEAEGGAAGPAVHLASPVTRPAWWPVAGEGKQRWLQRPEVLDEGIKRAGGKSNKTKIATALFEMSRDVWTWDAQSIRVQLTQLQLIR